MTRGDVFTTPWVRWLLRQVHLIPIYRFHDGFSALRQNEESFAKAKRILGQGGAILIMAEGGMKHEKRLRSLQKGAARIGFGAMQEYGLKDVMIQPVGVNYTYADQPRSVIMADFAKPISLSEYTRTEETVSQQVLETVTKQIASDLRERVIHIEKREDEQLAERVLQLVRIQSNSILPILSSDRRPLEVEHAAMVQLNRLSAVEKTTFCQELAPYFHKLEELSIHNEDVATNPIQSAKDQMLAPLIFGLHFLIWPFHWPPVQLGRWITRKTVRIIEFQSSILLGSMMFGWALWWFLLAGISSQFGIIPGVIFLILFPISAGWVVWSSEWIRIYQQAKQWQDLPTEVRDALVAQRRTLLDNWSEQCRLEK